MSDISADAITAAAKVIHWLSCGECVYQPEELTAVSKRDREDAEQILTAAAPALRASLYGSSDKRLAIEAARATGRQEERERTHGPTGISLIAAERSRQVSAEGYAPSATRNTRTVNSLRPPSATRQRTPPGADDHQAAADLETVR